MKKRFAKTVALVVAAALTAGAPGSVMAVRNGGCAGSVSTGTVSGYRSDDVTWNAAAQRR